LQHFEAVGCAQLSDAAIDDLVAPALQSLNLSECTALRRPVLVCPALTSLNLSFCGRLVDEAVQRALLHCPKLSELRLNYSRIVRPLARHAPSLRRLSMRSSPVDTEGLEAAFCPGDLETLDVRDCWCLTGLPRAALVAASVGRCQILAVGSAIGADALAALQAPEGVEAARAEQYAAPVAV